MTNVVLHVPAAYAASYSRMMTDILVTIRVPRVEPKAEYWKNRLLESFYKYSDP